MFGISLEKRTVRNLKCQNGAWLWELSSEPKIMYFTDDTGEGVFCQKQVRETNLANECDIHQIAGTCDFSLRNYSLSGARKKLNRILAEGEV